MTGRTRFSITLPVGGGPSHENPHRRRRRRPARARGIRAGAGRLYDGQGGGRAVRRAPFAAEVPDLAILDINLPGGSGFDVCEAIRKQSRIPIMMLTARGEEEDLVKALDLGADDYLTKPFSPRTLLARVRALLRRAGLEAGGAMTAGGLSLDLEAHALRVGDAAPVKLTKLETRLLQILHRKCRTRRRHRAVADARLGSSRQWRPATAEAARASPAAEDRRDPMPRYLQPSGCYRLRQTRPESVDQKPGLSR